MYIFPFVGNLIIYNQFVLPFLFKSLFFSVCLFPEEQLWSYQNYLFILTLTFSLLPGWLMLLVRLLFRVGGFCRALKRDRSPPVSLTWRDYLVSPLEKRLLLLTVLNCSLLQTQVTILGLHRAEGRGVSRWDAGGRGVSRWDAGGRGVSRWDAGGRGVSRWDRKVITVPPLLKGHESSARMEAFRMETSEVFVVLLNDLTDVGGGVFWTGQC